SGATTDPKLFVVAATPIKNAADEVIGLAVIEKELTKAVLDQINFSRKDIHLSLFYHEQILASTVDKPFDVQALPDQAAIHQSLNGTIAISPDYMRMSDGSQDSIAYVPIRIGRNSDVIAILHVEANALFLFQTDIIRSTLLVFGVLALATLLFIIVF